MSTPGPATTIAQNVYPPAGPQPLPVLTMAPLGSSDTGADALPGPAKLALGVAAGRPDGLLREGWRWVAYRSLGFALRAKRLDEPERWVGVELVSLRLAGPIFRLPRREVPAGTVRTSCRRVVLLWTRDVVTLAKANRSKRTGVRPEKSGTWGSEAWSWVVGLPGSIPRSLDITDAKLIIRRDPA